VQAAETVAGENSPPHLVLRTEARRMAVIIRQIEVVSPGCFGEAAAVIRQLAAGDDVAPDDLMAALALVRLIIWKRRGALGGMMPPEPRRP
jgi:hypothetical protein